MLILTNWLFVLLQVIYNIFIFNKVQFNIIYNIILNSYKNTNIITIKVEVNWKIKIIILHACYFIIIKLNAYEFFNKYEFVHCKLKRIPNFVTEISIRNNSQYV